MSLAVRWMLILGCLMLAVLEAPRSSALVVEDLAGPYADAPLLPEARPAGLARPRPLHGQPGTSALSLAHAGTE